MSVTVTRGLTEQDLLGGGQRIGVRRSGQIRCTGPFCAWACIALAELRSASAVG